MHDGRRPDDATFHECFPIAPKLHEPSDGLLIAVPLYRSPELLPPLVDALIAQADELRALNATVLLIDDSPEDPTLAAALDEALARCDGQVAVERLANPQNLGFVATANRALALALDSDRDVILLNSDALPRPGAFRELAAVAYLDPMISVVSPRSDNATICNSPAADAVRVGGPEAAFAAHRRLAPLLPRFGLVPTAVGFCLFVKRLMLAEFGLFDPAYGAGYNEENDFVRRCNQRGYRAALANRAYVHHLGEVSFGRSGTARAERERVNHALLVERYPEYDGIVARYFRSDAYRAELVAGGLVPRGGRLRVLLDCRVLGEFFNGTFEHIRRVLDAFAVRFSETYDIRVLCAEPAFRFHGLHRIEGLRHVTAADAEREPAAVAFRLNQPDREAAATLARMGAVTGALMLDTIAMDCEQLDDADRRATWQAAADTMDLLGFNSAFSRDQFARRFAVPDGTVRFVSLCSTDPADYRAARPATGGGGILLIGNHYPHKHMRETVLALRAAGSTRPIVSFGLAIDEPEVVASHVAGHIAEAEVDRLYVEADVALFPSHYEGFGLPIVHALARELPVIARDLPCAREIKARSPHGRNLHLCASTAEMAALAAEAPRWIAAHTPPPEPVASWADAAAALADAFEAAIARFDFERCRCRQAAAAAFEGLVADSSAAGSVTPEMVRRGRLAVARLRQRVEQGRRERDAAATARQAAEQEVAGAQARASASVQRAVAAEAREVALTAALADAEALLACAWAQGAAVEPSPAWSRLLPLRLWTPRSLADRPPAVAAGLRLRCPPDLDDPARLRERLVRWTRALGPGAPVELALPDAVVARLADGLTRAQALAALLDVAGCRLVRVRAGAITAVRATKARRWPVAPDGLAPEPFISAAFQMVLGRAPEPPAREHYRRALARGLARDEVLVELAASPERWLSALTAA